jgi:hypothetical protein
MAFMLSCGMVSVLRRNMKIRIGLELMVDCAAQEMSLAQDLEFERETERDDVEPKERDMAPGPKAQQ